jgi:predicted dehydrogenase
MVQAAGAGLLGLTAAGALAAGPPEAGPPEPTRLGVIGLDTSHVIAFTKLLNDPDPKGELAGARVVAAFPGGNPEFPLSRDRVGPYTGQLKDMGVAIVDSIPALLQDVDVVLLESVDGTQHLEQVEPVFRAGKPVFIDKPLAASLADALAIAGLGERHEVPWFSASALRFSPNYLALRDKEKVGAVVGCDAYGQTRAAPGHPDLFWYGVHGVELLYTVMGPGCTSVTRVQTPLTEQVTGLWGEGRVGTFRGIREHTHQTDFGATAFGTKAILKADGYAGYEPLVRQIVAFARTRVPPVAAEETLEIFAFMEAAEESKRRGGAAVTLEGVMAKARADVGNRGVGR